MKYPAIFSITVGGMMILQWIFFLAAGQVPELQTAPWEIAHHITAEMLTALVLIASGAGLLKKTGWARTTTLLGLGMVIYSSINSAGYFAQSGQWVFVVMFAVLIVLAIVAVLKLAPNPSRQK
jgi:hypothetical protein